MPLHLRSLALGTLDSLQVSDYAIFAGQDERPLQGLGGLLDWRLAAGLSQFLRNEHISGDRGECFLTPSLGAVPGGRIFCFGLGPLAQVTPEIFARMAQHAAEVLARAGVSSLAVGLPERPALPIAARTLRDAFQSLEEAEIYLLGPLDELERTLLVSGITGPSKVPSTRRA